MAKLDSTIIYGKLTVNSDIETSGSIYVNGENFDDKYLGKNDTAKSSLKLENERTISLSGDATGSTGFDGTQNKTINVTLANSGVTAGTYTKVTVDKKGRVTTGISPTTLSGYGITDATPSSHIGSTGSAHGLASSSVNGFMSSNDYNKLKSIANNANNYTHPTGDGNQHVPANGTTNNGKVLKAGSAAGSLSWQNIAFAELINKPTTLAGYGITDAAKSNHVHNNATTTSNGFMSSTDKVKLDGIATNANNYVHPDNESIRHVTDTEKNRWNNTYTKPQVDELLSTFTTGMDWKASVNTYDDILTTYPNPQDGWTVNVKDTDITYRYDGKSWVAISANAIPLASSTVDGKMSKGDKVKLDGIATNANNYVHPSTHAPSIIKQDENNRFVTDTEKNTWNAKASTAVVTTTTNGLMSSADKVKLNGIAANANNYTHPTSDGNKHIPVTGTTSDGKFLKAGSTAGSFSWQSLAWNDIRSGKPTTLSGYGITDASLNTHKHDSDYLKLSGGTLTGTLSAKNLISSSSNDGSAVELQLSRTKDGNRSWRFKNDGGSLFIENKSTDGTDWSTSLKILSGELNQLYVGNNKVYHTGNKPTLSELGAAPSTHVNSTDGHPNVTTTASGFMSKEDKVKLDSISANANNYVHPNTDGNKHVPANGTTNNGKVLKASATAGVYNWSNIAFSELTSKPTTLSGYGITDGVVNTRSINAGAGLIGGGNLTADRTLSINFGGNGTATTVSRSDHNHTSLTGVTSLGFNTGNTGVSQIKSTVTSSLHTLDFYLNNAPNGDHWRWRFKSNTSGASELSLMELKPVSDNKGELRVSGKIIADSISASVASTSQDGLMSKSDKSKLDGIANNANNYVHPTNDGNKHIPANGTTNGGKVLKAGSTAGAYTWENIVWGDIKSGKPTTLSGYGITDATPSSHINSTSGHPNVTTTANGFMSKDDKVKLDGIATNANNYVHPSTHPATMITQNSDNRFVSDTEKSTWNAKETTTGSQQKADKALADAKTYVNGYAEPKFTKNTAFNKNFGTAADTVAQGNHNHNSTYLGINATAVAANKLATARKINGVSFDGTSDITIANVENADKLDGFHGVDFITSYSTNTTDTNGRWTVTIPNITNLFDGLTIKIRLSTSYNGTYNTLNVNGLGEKLVWYRHNNRMTSHVPMYSELYLTYRTNAGSYTNNSVTYTDGWIMNVSYQDGNTYNIVNYNENISIGEKIYGYDILIKAKDDKWYPITKKTSDAATSTTTGNSTIDFKIDSDILYYSGTGDVNAGNLSGGNLRITSQFAAKNPLYGTFTQYKDIYLVGTIVNGYLRIDSTNYWTHNLPTQDDGKVYVYLGYMSDANNARLSSNHPIYVYKDGGIKVYSGYSEASNKSAMATKLETARKINGVAFDGTKDITVKAVPEAHTHNPTDIVQSSSYRFVTDTEKNTWNAKANASGNINQDFNAKVLNVSSHILPTKAGLNIGSASNRFDTIYVDEARLSTNTLYIGDTPILGTDDDTIVIKADPDQSVLMKTSASGTTKIISESGVEMSTSGMNADVVVKASGVGSKVNVSADSQVNFTAPNINFVGESNVQGNLSANDVVVRGNLTVQGQSTIINATELKITDNIIEINKDEKGVGVSTGQAGIKINRGDADDYYILFDESDDMFKLGTQSSLQTIASQSWVNNVMYKHPSTHPATMITQDANNRFVTDTEKNTWNAKASTAVATTTANGLMSSSDKTKLNGIAANANNYSHPTSDGSKHVPANGTANGGKFLKASATAGTYTWENMTWSDIKSGKPTTLAGYGITDASLSTHKHDSDYLKLTGGSLTGNLKFTNNQQGIVWDLNNDSAFIQFKNNSDNDTDSYLQFNTADNGNEYFKFTQKNSTDTVELMSIKSDGVRVKGNLVYHAGNKPTASDINAAPSSHVNSASGHPNATTSANGFMSSTDKSKLDGIATNANNYVHPTSDGNKHIPANGTTNGGKVLKASATAGTYTWENIVWGDIKSGKPTTLSGYGITDAAPIGHVNSTSGHPNATTSASGFMSKDDKVKLNGIAANANNYSHPSTHPATMIVQDSGNRFVTDAEKSTWNSKADGSHTHSVATTSANGFMSSADKTKLNGIANNANNYVHPTDAGNKHIPSGGATNQYLKYSASGTAQWATIAYGELSGRPTLGNSASKDVGTGSNNVAAGNHTHSYNDLTNKPTTVILDNNKAVIKYNAQKESIDFIFN